MAPRKKTKGEMVNNLMDPYAAVEENRDEEDAPQMDDFDDVNDVTQRLGNKKRLEKLRRRGPIDSSLSTGKYAAAPMAGSDDDMGSIDENFDADDMDFDVDGKMDDMFGLLDDEGQDEKGAGIQTEEQFEEWWADNKKNAPKKAKLKASKRARDAFDGGELDRDDQDLLAQVEALRERQMNITAVDDFDAAAASEMKGNSEVSQHNVMLFTKLLALRLKMQPCVTKAVQFPQYYAYDSYLKKDKDTKAAVNEARKAAAETAQDLLAAAGSKVTSATSSEQRTCSRRTSASCGRSTRASSSGATARAARPTPR